MAWVVLAILTGLHIATAAQAQLPGGASYVASAGFLTSIFSSYYIKPGPTQERQLAIYDPILNYTYPLNLTDAKTIPTANNDPVYYPPGIANLTNATSEA